MIQLTYIYINLHKPQNSPGQDYEGKTNKNQSTPTTPLGLFLHSPPGKPLEATRGGNAEGHHASVTQFPPLEMETRLDSLQCRLDSLQTPRTPQLNSSVTHSVPRRAHRSSMELAPESGLHCPTSSLGASCLDLEPHFWVLA